MLARTGRTDDDMVPKLRPDGSKSRPGNPRLGVRFGPILPVAGRIGQVPIDHGVMHQHEESVMPSTIRLHRVLKAAPDRVYRAFTDADAMAKWLPPYGFTCKVRHLDARVGGKHEASFTNFTTGKSHAFGGTYLELKPNELIRYTDRFDDPALPGEMLVTVTLEKVSCGTELTVVQEGVPDVIPAEACYLGWQESLTQLANLVDPEILD